MLICPCFRKRMPSCLHYFPAWQGTRTLNLPVLHYQESCNWVALATEFVLTILGAGLLKSKYFQVFDVIGCCCFLEPSLWLVFLPSVLIRIFTSSKDKSLSLPNHTHLTVTTSVELIQLHCEVLEQDCNSERTQLSPQHSHCLKPWPVHSKLWAKLINYIALLNQRQM